MVGRREWWLDVEEHSGGIDHGFDASLDVIAHLFPVVRDALVNELDHLPGFLEVLALRLVEVHELLPQPDLGALGDRIDLADHHPENLEAAGNIGHQSNHLIVELPDQVSVQLAVDGVDVQLALVEVVVGVRVNLVDDLLGDSLRWILDHSDSLHDGCNAFAIRHSLDACRAP